MQRLSKPFYNGDIVVFQELPKPKLNWFRRIFYKYKKPYISYYVRKGKDAYSNDLLEYRIPLKNNEFFEASYRNINTILLKKIFPKFEYELKDFEYRCDSYLIYNGNIKNFILASKEDIKRVERKQKLEKINESR